MKLGHSSGVGDMRSHQEVSEMQENAGCTMRTENSLMRLTGMHEDAWGRCSKIHGACTALSQTETTYAISDA